ncbi:cytochrome d ubiquinol oxidase subunit II [Barrientosiimonas humi]|uniref:Cytochrome d ubiquinol oxidase subunit II n=1 Tax=Barrientosiimonas humi TaxID=999931 RepID=A0A542WZ84_9MICO|nr:cytochrome d ubiquinol oxidase subunit II [Barrientosiimonas humi]TQL28896.1 cytochrome d ubiquinol oxidase subunit II [Barrientosiimonas humi]CAG7571250.1 Cytochrome bd-I ubiquinol oxidase subunit 2 [Barrientosiimonas humi]
MELTTVWFILIAVLWTGYFILEGFDFGVGMMLPIVGKGKNAAETEKRRRLVLTTIGPFWDGNEVWLITAGGAMFAAFPHWYATMFSGFYLPLLLVLVALIVRNVGLEYRPKRNDMTWRRRWDLMIVFGSVLPPLLLGVALTNTVRGLPIDQNMEFTGSLLSLLNPLSLLGGVTHVVVSLAHGAFFVALKTKGDVRELARGLGARVGVVAGVLVAALLLWLGVASDGTALTWATSAVAVVALVAALAFNRRGAEGAAFAGTFVTIGMTVATYFLLLFPDVMPSSTNEAWSLTTTNAASSHLTLTIMTWAAVIFLPIVLAYSAYNYWVFRKRVSIQMLSEESAPQIERVES